MDMPQKRASERLLHAVLYEICAMALLIPLGSLLLGARLLHLGVLALLMSSIAMTWNMGFNAVFEQLERRLQWQRTPRLRVLHAITFEGGLVFLCVPTVAWWMQISYLDALLMDLGILLFFLPYTYVFNWCYDTLRARWHAPPPCAG